jgi:hypothetical protein
VAASQETCLRVAPTRRIAANRSSRRAADSRVAVAMKISTGARMASATTDKMRSMALAPPPGSGGTKSSPLGFDWPPWSAGTAVAIEVTCALPEVCASCAGVRPTMMTSESGDGSPASPITPARRPG